MKILSVLLTSLLVIVAIGIGESSAAEKKTWSAKGSSQDYEIGAGDILEITTWKEPDFTRDDVLVRLDGKITFPLLNDVQAAGLTTLDLKGIIENGLKDYVSNPVVTVNVRQPLSKRFYILGEVQRTGEYPLVKHLTVLQAFALAGGFTEWAAKDEIILLRNEDGKDKMYRIDYKDITKGKDLSQNIKLQPDDTIIVP
jgi:polysaccharide export outer membrane protein